jgi:hypothetical protein
MPGTRSDQVDDQAITLAGIGPEAATDRLQMEHARAGRARDDDRVDRRCSVGFALHQEAVAG